MVEKIKEAASIILKKLVFLIIATAVYAFVNYYGLIIAFLIGGFIGVFVIPPAINIGLSCLHNLIKHESGIEKSWTDLYPLLGMIALIIYFYYESLGGFFPSLSFSGLYFIYIIIYLIFLGIKYAWLYDDGKNNDGEKDSDKTDPPTV